MATHDPRFPRAGQAVYFTMEYENGAEFGMGRFKTGPARVEQDLTGLNYLSNPTRVIPWRHVTKWFPCADELRKRKHTRKVNVQR
jgi:hypothetical protein